MLFRLAVILWTVFAAGAALAAPAPIAEVCEISGLITDIKTVTRASPDGTPLATPAPPEMHVAVRIDERVPHGASPEKTTCKTAPVKGRMITYKLCSPTQVKAGDTVHGTEGLAIVNPYGVGCLFDVVVLPKT